jgi:hypothetical protein
LENVEESKKEKAPKLKGFFFSNWWRRRESNKRLFFQPYDIAKEISRIFFMDSTWIVFYAIYDCKRTVSINELTILCCTMEGSVQFNYETGTSIHDAVM